MEQKLGKSVFTEIVPFSLLYLAEDYHQKYFLQGIPELSGELREYYPNFYGIIKSTTAARLNSFIAGYGSPEQLHEELERYGLSPEGKQLLLEIVGF